MVPAKRSDGEDQLERSMCRVLGGRSLRAGSWSRTKDRLVADGWMQEKP
jgi:hypothetical protein